MPSRARERGGPRAVPRGARLLPEAGNIHPLPAGGSGARGSPGWLGEGGGRVYSKHPDPLFLAPQLRGPNSAHPRGSGVQPAAGFRLHRWLQAESNHAHPVLEKVTHEIPVAFRGPALAWLGWGWGEIGCFTGVTTERKLSGSIANYQGIC